MFFSSPDVMDARGCQFVIHDVDEPVEAVEWLLLREHLVAVSSLHQEHHVC